ncbi:SPOR domain-containing protein [Legionella drozanskii]|uniref:Sporulation related domain protein n=1 Tax=Legionella drozanskii LLAP-1 TaxID=1212489 RepID=A0A0W0TE09_9GAMM|nr:SPOR domain-containing protein [Legionella drozanskii]KTC93815.1 Sporulation related domain protein [Legionella drozanskii LLAP-1]
MKRLSPKSGIFIFFSLFAIQAFPHAVTFYGLDSIQHYHGRSNGAFFIQMGNFSGKLNAYHYQKRMQQKISHPIKLERKGGNYVVMIGPLGSMGQVREVVAQAKSRFVQTKKIPQESRFRFLRGKQKQSVPLTRTIIRPEKEPLEKEPVEYFGLINENWYVGVFGGVQWNDISHKITVNNSSRAESPYNKDTYLSGINNQAFAGASGGYRWEFNNRWLPALGVGLRYQRVFARNVGKSILQYSMPEFANYNYSWQIYSDVALATAKFNFLQYRAFAPYLSGSVGAGFNKSRNYKEVALEGVTPRISPFFTDNLTTQFAYNVGAGVDLQISSRFIVSLGYEYQDLGSVSSGSGAGNNWVGQALNLGSYRSNAALLSVNYLLGDR